MEATASNRFKAVHEQEKTRENTEPAHFLAYWKKVELRLYHFCSAD